MLPIELFKSKKNFFNFIVLIAILGRNDIDLAN